MRPRYFGFADLAAKETEVRRGLLRRRSRSLAFGPVINPHRVVNRSGRERLSIAMFVDPDFDTPIVPVTRPGDASRYPPVTCGDYILGRFDKAFAYRNNG